MAAFASHRILGASSALAFAHRGGSLLWPENTLFAFSGAVKMGCSVIETDVRLTQDGQLVTFHDETLERTTNGRGPVRQYDLRRLKQLDAGFHHTDGKGEHSYRDRDIRIPTLEEALELCPNTAFNVDLKDEQPEAQAALWRLIKAKRLEDRVLVATFNHSTISSFRQVCKGRIPTSASRDEVLRFWTAAQMGMSYLLKRDYSALQIPVKAYGVKLCSQQVVSAAKALQLRVHVWTINQMEQMKNLLELGVDGLISDRPDVVLELLDQTGANDSRAANSI